MVMVQEEAFFRSEVGQRLSAMKAKKNITTSKIDVVTLESRQSREFFANS